MQFSHIICGGPFFIIHEKSFGKCFLQLCIFDPIYISLLICSSYFLGFRNIKYGKRPPLELVILCLRIFFSLLLSFISLFTLYDIYYNKESCTLSDIVELIIMSFTWLVHAVYLKILVRSITPKIRGPTSVNVCFLFCFVSMIVHLYLKCKDKDYHCIQRLDIFTLMLYTLYMCTLLPDKCLRDNTDLSINSIIPEEEPLLNSVACRYNAFHEDTDPEDLGTAESCNIFSKLLFTWVKPMMLKGYLKHLRTVDDVYDLPEDLQAFHLSEKFSNAVGETSPFKSEGSSIHLIKYLHKYFAFEFYSIGVLKFLSDCFMFGGPILLNALVSNLEMESDNNDGYYYALGLFLTTALAAILSSQYNYLISRISLKIKAALILIIYQKTLSTSKVTLSIMNSGEILNFVSTDTDRIVNFCQSFHQFWSLPVQVIIALVLLYQQLNICFIVGIVFMLLVVPLNQYIAKKIASYSTMLMNAKDKRLKLMNEIISGIRVIKINTWEKLFCGKLKIIRDQEIKYLKKRKYLDALCVYFWATTPILISFLTFTLYASLGYELTAAKVFTSIALFNILIMPLNAFPWVLNGLMEAWVSIKRLNSFLLLPNIEFKDFYSDSNKPNVKFEIVNGVFSYARDVNSDTKQESSVTPSNSKISHFNIGPISIIANQGDFLCIFGKVGSGKSSLLSSILADVNCIDGEVKMNISDRKKGIGYVSQNPWIQQKSIKDNILFGKPFISQRYRSVLESCALVDDLKILPYGDNTKVGDKGVTLSGGQRARIALARAVYQDFDIYLLDDPLSAVDAHVADHIYSNCILGTLKNKTRILCTHKTKYAENADYLLIMSEGKIISQGPPIQALQIYFIHDNEDSIEDLDEKKDVCNMVQSENKDEPNDNEEEKEEGDIKLHVYKSYLKAVGTFLTAAVLMFCVLMQASKTVSDWWLSFWITNVQNKNKSEMHNILITKNSSLPSHSLVFYLSIYGGLAFANSVFTLFRAFFFAYAGLKAAVVLHNQLLNTVIKARTCFFDVTPLGRILNRFSSDVYTVDDTLPFIMNILLAQVFSLIGSLIITCYGLPWITILILILSVMYFQVQHYYRHTSRELKRLSSISLSPIYAHFSETLSGHSTIRALGTTMKFQKENMDNLDCNLRTVLSTAAASQWLNIRLQFIGVLIVTGVAFIALIQREFGDINAALVGLALSYALSVTSLLNGSITAFTETEKEIVSVERILQYVEGIKTESDTYLQLPPFAWPSHGVLSFVNVSLQYKPNSPYALKDISFETRPGEKIGIVGRTGSGKSSLIQVLCRMVNYFEGAVFIDGVNIANLELKKLRSSLSVIPQDPFLFSGSIRENLDPNHIHSDAELWKALRYCHMEEKAQSFGGLDIEMEETDQNFSVGEKQLICLSRALLKRSKILCMDEATANIDFQTESFIRHAVQMAFRHSTVLIIAHRIETVMDCDRVLVMKESKILEFDKPSTLLSNTKSEFYKLVYSD